MKRSVCRILSVLLLFSLFLGGTGCGKEPQERTYEITFVWGGNTKTLSVAEGQIPVCPEDTEIPEDGEHYYRFLGWDREIAPASADATYTAQYGVYGTKTYTVMWVLEDGRIVRETYHEGEMPAIPEFAETYSTEKEIFTFTGWDQEVVSVTKNAVYRANYHSEPGYFAELESAKDGRRAIVTMTYDDGIYDTAVYLNEQFKKYGLCGTCTVIVNNVLPSSYDPTSALYLKWADVFADGTLEPQSHSTSHMILPSSHWAGSSRESNMKNNTQFNYGKELTDSKNRLEQYFPDVDVITFAPSNNTLSSFSYQTDGNGALLRDAKGELIPVEDGGAMAVVQKNYFAVRQGNRGFQSLDPAFGTSAGSWHNLYMRSICAKDIHNDAGIAKGWVDDAVSGGGWMVTMCHAVQTSVSDNHMTPEAAESFFAYLSEQVENGNVWCATFSEATKYIRERQQTTVSETYENGQVTVRMAIDRHTPDDLYLDEEIFNDPLTVKIRVPEDWKQVSYVLNGETVTAPAFEENGVAFARISCIPGADRETVQLTVSGIR